MFCQKVPRPALRKQVVDYVVTSHNYSQRQAYEVTGQQPSSKSAPKGLNCFSQIGSTVTIRIAYNSTL